MPSLWYWVDPTIPTPSLPVPYPLNSDGKFHAINPDQGNGKDCFFIAALSSFLWMTKEFEPNVDNNGYYVFELFDAENNFQPRPVKAKPKIPMYWDSINRQWKPYFARSNRSNEFWPALYEKAWVNLQQGNYDDRYVPEMDLYLNGMGNPGIVLRELTGKDVWLYWAKDMDDRIDKFISLLGDGVPRKTKYETVATTYYSTQAMQAATGRNDVSYNSTNFVANHSYSILGGLLIGDNLYVIIRNPYGCTKGDPGVAAQLGDWDYLDDVNQMPHIIPLPQADGVFAVEFGTFTTYFDKIAYASGRQVIPD